MAVTTTISPGPRSTEQDGLDKAIESHPIWTELRGPVNDIDSNTASERLHALKQSGGLGGADNVVFDMTGNVWDPRNGDYLGSLTQP